MSLPTLILAIVCVTLAGLLALSLAGRHQAAVRAAASPSPSASGTDVPPAGAPDAVAAFIGAWAQAPADRDNVLASVTVTGVAATVDARDRQDTRRRPRRVAPPCTPGSTTSSTPPSSR